MKLKSKTLQTVVVVLVILVIFSFMGRGLWKNWRQIPFEQVHFNYWLLIVSYLCLFGWFATFAGAWKLILAAYGSHLRFFRAFQIMAVSNLGKYIPGKVWFTLGRMYLAKQFGVPERISIAGVVLETLLLVISAGMIGLLTVAGPWMEQVPFRVSVLALVVVLCGLLVVHPRIFGRLANFALRKLKRDEIQMNLSYGGIVGLLVLYFVVWLWQGIGFFFLIRSFYEIEIAQWPFFWGIYTLAWMIAFLSLLTPGGLGVREGIMIFFLSFYMPVSMAIIVAVLARVWTTIAELAFFSISTLGMRRRRGKQLEMEGR